MKLEDLANNDNSIKAIFNKGNSLCLEILSWNEKIINVEFRNCYGAKAKMAINAEIGDIKTNIQSPFSNEIIEEVMSGNGEECEWSKLQDIVFYDVWSNRVILEVIAESVFIS